MSVLLRSVMATKKEIRDRAAGTEEVPVGLVRKVFKTVVFTAAIAAYLNTALEPTADSAFSLSRSAGFATRQFGGGSAFGR